MRLFYNRTSRRIGSRNPKRIKAVLEAVLRLTGERGMICCHFKSICYRISIVSDVAYPESVNKLGKHACMPALIGPVLQSRGKRLIQDRLW
jgi:hypothetical protein